VLLIDHDRGKAWERGEHSQPGADHDAHPPLDRSDPGPGALGLAQSAMQNRHRLRWKAPGDQPGQLRGECDLRHHEKELRIGPGRQDGLEPAQIHLGFAATGHTVEHRDAEALRRTERIEHPLLIGAQRLARRRATGDGSGAGPPRQSRRRGKPRWRGWPGGVCLDRCAYPAASPSCTRKRARPRFRRRRCTQRPRHGKECELTHRPVVIPRRKAQQGKPARGQHRCILESALDRLQPLRREVALRAEIQHKADPPAGPPGHLNPVAGRQPASKRRPDPVIKPGRNRDIQGDPRNSRISGETRIHFKFEA